MIDSWKELRTIFTAVKSTNINSIEVCFKANLFSIFLPVLIVNFLINDINIVVLFNTLMDLTKSEVILTEKNNLGRWLSLTLWTSS